MRLPLKSAGVWMPRSRRATTPWSRSVRKMVAITVTGSLLMPANMMGMSATVPRLAWPCITASMAALPLERACSVTSKPWSAK